MSNLAAPTLPAHIDDMVGAIARLHADHQSQATRLQRLIQKLTVYVARPSFIAILTIVMAIWIASNLALLGSGHQPWDAPPFAWLQGVTGAGALYIAILILSTQRRDDELASHREQLMLELVILSEQKTAKIIELIEELRRDDPHIRNRLDDEATALSAPAEPQAVLKAIKSKYDEAMNR